MFSEDTHPGVAVPPVNVVSANVVKISMGYSMKIDDANHVNSFHSTSRAKPKDESTAGTLDGWPTQVCRRALSSLELGLR